MIVVGEKINMSRRPVANAWQQRDAAYIARLAVAQAHAGAHYIDVNSGVYGEEAECMEWLVSVVQEAVDLPLSIDTTHPVALEKALQLARRPPMINSVSCETARVRAFLPLLKGADCTVVGLLMSDRGLPATVEDRIQNAQDLIDTLTAAGFEKGRIFIDPCIVPVASDTAAAGNVLEALWAIKQRWPDIHLIAGISNVSFGLPRRSVLNQVFFAMCCARGLDAAILDPTDPGIRSSIAAVKVLLGQDPYCGQYLREFRKGMCSKREEVRSTEQ